MDAIDRAEGNDPVWTREWLLNDWRRPRFEMPRDTRVIVAPDGGLAAYVEVYDSVPRAEVESVGRVHPDHRGRGIGAFLLAWAEDRASERAWGNDIELYVDSSRSSATSGTWRSSCDDLPRLERPAACPSTGSNPGMTNAPSTSS